MREPLLADERATTDRGESLYLGWMAQRKSRPGVPSRAFWGNPAYEPMEPMKPMDSWLLLQIPYVPMIPPYTSFPINPRFYLGLCKKDYFDPHSKYNLQNLI